jgi:hypothetical protein
MVWGKSRVSSRPKTVPPEKAVQKNGKDFVLEKQRRQCRAILFDAGRGHGFSGKGLVDYVDRAMARM